MTEFPGSGAIERWTLTVTQHEKNVRALPCIVTQRHPVTLHHCHGGSMKDRGFHTGTSLRGSNPWLIIPLIADLHVGKWGIDYGYGVERWERDFGLQADMLDEVDQQLGYPKSIWEIAKAWESRHLQPLMPPEGFDGQT